MYGLTRATTTLLAAGVAGLLIWIATQIDEDSLGGFWAVYGLIAGAGLVMALSQLLGGWTKWGWPRLAITVFVIAFLPIAIVSLWVVLAAEPGNGWFHRHVLSWSGDLHIRGLVNDLKEYVSVFAFGIGLVFGFSFDTTGPIRRGRDVVTDSGRATTPPPRRRGFFGRGRTETPAATDRRAAADEPLTGDREAARTDRTGEREIVTTARRSDGGDRS
jgi:hypothetical protein